MGRKESVEDCHQRRIQIVSLVVLLPCSLMHSPARPMVVNTSISIMTTVLDIVKRGGSLEDAQAEVEAKIEEWFERTVQDRSFGRQR